MKQIPSISLEDAVGFVTLDLRLRVSGKRGYDYGYDVLPSQAAHRWATKTSSGNQPIIESLVRQNGHIFYDATWELCRRGILRPGIASSGKQAIDDGGYSLTEFGKIWFEKGVEDDIVILEAGSLSRVLEKYRKFFGEGFHQRSQEAIRCRQAEAWLACCAMVGAASESILLAMAIAKTRNEQDVLAQYQSRSGRKNVTNMLTGKATKHLGDSLNVFLGLLAYWRDDAAHGQQSPISVANADESLRQLLHFAQWAEKNWKELTC